MLPAHCGTPPQRSRTAGGPPRHKRPRDGPDHKPLRIGHCAPRPVPGLAPGFRRSNLTTAICLPHTLELTPLRFPALVSAIGNRFSSCVPCISCGTTVARSTPLSLRAGAIVDRYLNCMLAKRHRAHVSTGSQAPWAKSDSQTRRLQLCLFQPFVLVVYGNRRVACLVAASGDPSLGASLGKALTGS